MKPGDLVTIADFRHSCFLTTEVISKDRGHCISILNGTVGIIIDECGSLGNFYYDVFIPEYGAIFEVKHRYIHHFENVK